MLRALKPLAALLLSLGATAAFAQAKSAASAPANQQATSGKAQQGAAASQPAQPKSGLGKEVSKQQGQQAAEVIDPPNPVEAVEQAIKDIEGTQLNDAQYERIKKIYIRRERQKSMPYTTPAKPITRTLAVNLDPGVAPPILRVSRGQLTSVVFSDVGGQPWIIKDVRLNRDVFSDGREPNQQNAQAEPTNAMTIEPKGVAVYGNVTVWLKGLSTPVIFMLSAAQEEVDLRVDAKVPGRNPDSGDVEYTSAPNIDVLLTGFLDGVPPKEARRLSVTGLPQTEAWLYQDNLYVRTNAEVQYPAYFSAARSTSGKAVYRFASRQNSVTLLSNGKAVTVFIED